MSHGRPTSPTPSKELGRVRGFQIPALSKSIFPVAFNLTAVSTTCSSVSALQGPAIRKGDFFLVDVKLIRDVIIFIILGRLY